MDNEQEQSFARDVKQTMQQRISENEAQRQTDYSAGDEIKKTLQPVTEAPVEEEEGLLKKIFGGLFGR